ncbi:MAG: hypothetical protein GC191_01925 [Azospirillum sp.]|nr:hypothetical protein [Azospirillum sp.]
MTIVDIVGDDGTSHAVEIGSAEMAAAMVNFCIERRTRLPAKSKKWLEVINDALALLIEVEQTGEDTRKPRRFGRQPTAAASGR